MISIIQFFSVFKEVKRRWVYVFDPSGEDYYSQASETIGHLAFNDLFKGDCDDYSIMIASCIRAIGGEVQLVRTTTIRADGTSIGHLYPEVKIGDKKDLDSSILHALLEEAHSVGLIAVLASWKICCFCV